MACASAHHRSAAGLRITGSVFFGNMEGTFRKGALTTYYPRSSGSDYSPNNRGRHVLTQRANGEVQCVVHPARPPARRTASILSSANFDDPAHPAAGVWRSITAPHLRGFASRPPRGCDLHGQGRLICRASIARPCGERWTS
jgi:hypothetical protein